MGKLMFGISTEKCYLCVIGAFIIFLHLYLNRPCHPPRPCWSWWGWWTPPYSGPSRTYHGDPYSAWTDPHGLKEIHTELLVETFQSTGKNIHKTGKEDSIFATHFLLHNKETYIL